MNFEFDPAKSVANKTKHGIDFRQAQELWEDVDRLEIPARSLAEDRRQLIAKHGGKLWTAVFTLRGENIRVISVRRARDNEKADYEQTKDEDDGQES